MKCSGANGSTSTEMSFLRLEVLFAWWLHYECDDCEQGHSWLRVRGFSVISRLPTA